VEICSNLVILGTLVCLVVALVSTALAVLLSCRVRCPYYCIFHLLMANKMMMIYLDRLPDITNISYCTVSGERVVDEGGATKG